MKSLVLILGFIGIAMAQRPFYAGSRPGRTTTPPSLENRFGEDGQPITTERLPYDALGDWLLVEEIKKWPVDKQPFWYINRQQIEAHRQQPYVPREPIDSRPTFAGSRPTNINNVAQNDRFGSNTQNLNARPQSSNNQNGFETDRNQYPRPQNINDQDRFISRPQDRYEADQNQNIRPERLNIQDRFATRPQDRFEGDRTRNQNRYENQNNLERGQRWNSALGKWEHN